MKIGIIVVVYNLNTRVFLLQMECIKKFCTDNNYTIEIIDNSTDNELSEAIKYHSSVMKLNYTRVRANNNDSSWSHSFAANFAYQRFENEYDIFFYLDHDCIPVKKFSIIEILRDYVIAGVEIGAHTKYFWPGCLMFNNTLISHNLVNFSPNGELRVDTGGELYKVIETHGRNKCLFFDEEGHGNPAFVNTPLYSFYMMIYNETFMHFINASGWNPTDRNEERLNSLINIVFDKIKNADEQNCI